MKTRPLLLAFFVVCAGALFAAWTKQNARVARIQGDTTFTSNTDTTATAVKMTAYLEALVTDDADTTKGRRGDWVPVNFDLLAAPVATTNYTAAGKTATGVQIAALLRQAALDEATRQGISP